MRTKDSAILSQSCPIASLLVLAVLGVAHLTSPLASTAAIPSQQAYVKASNVDAWNGFPYSGDIFGVSVTISSNTMVIGAPYEDSSAPGVNGNQSDNSAQDSGAVYVFVRSGTTWAQQAYLKASNPELGGGFGWSVAISGDTLVVGAPGDSSDATGVNGDQSNNNAPRSGAAYVFVRSGTNWSQQAYLKASNSGGWSPPGSVGDEFGTSLAISGDTVVVGANLEASNATGVNGNQSDNSAHGSGAAYVFVRNGTNWAQQAYLKASNTGGTLTPVDCCGDEFGISVAVSIDTLVVGAWGESSNATGVNGNQRDNSALGSGAAYVFIRNGTNWSQQAYLKASNAEEHDSFGRSVAVSGDTMVVGAFGEDSPATGVNGEQGNSADGSDTGALYVFVRSGTNWEQQAYIKASARLTPSFAPSFGYSVSISGNTIVAGAMRESSHAVGVNSTPSGNYVQQSGAAYVFVRRGTNWEQQAYLKASNNGSDDLFSLDSFGLSVATTDNTVVVGAPFEDSDATGVNGTGSDPWREFDSGAAYVFAGFCSACPKLAFDPDGNGGYVIRFFGTPGDSYRLQRAPSFTGPWDDFAILSTPASGFVAFQNAPLPFGEAFYRIVQP